MTTLTKPIWTPHAGPQKLAWERMDVKQLFVGGGRGCVHTDTLLDTPSGKVKISEWEGGDIYSYKDGKRIVTYATKSKRGTFEELYELRTKTGMSVICTDEHKFLCIDRRVQEGMEWVMLRDMTMSHLIICNKEGDDDSISAHVIESISSYGHDYYWDLHVPETNCYFAHGILHHNSGKTSYILGVCATQWAMYGKSARCLILRKQFRDLREIERQAIEMFVDTGIARYNASKHIFYGLGIYEGATIELGNLDRIDDYGRYHGNAYSLVCFDEITEFSSWELVDRMGSTLRSKDPVVNCIMRFTGNPGGRLHEEVKRRFYDPAPKGSQLLRTKLGVTRMMVHSTVKDNPSLWNNDPDYVNWLKELPEALRKAWYEGNWDLAIGAFFQDLWIPRTHIVQRVKPHQVPMDWEIRRAFDWGSSTPFCLIWYTISNGDPMGNGDYYPRGAMIILWEFYGQNPESGKLNDGMRWSSSRVAKEIAKREQDMGIDGRTLAGPADNQIMQDTDGLDSRIYRNFEREGILFCKSNKTSCAEGWEQIRTRLYGMNGRPMLYFTEDCSNGIRTVPSLSRHPTKLDDLDDNQEDHFCDCLRYAAMNHPIQTNFKSIKSIKRKDEAQTRLS